MTDELSNRIIYYGKHLTLFYEEDYRNEIYTEKTYYSQTRGFTLKYLFECIEDFERLTREYTKWLGIIFLLFFFKRNCFCPQFNTFILII